MKLLDRLAKLRQERQAKHARPQTGQKPARLTRSRLVWLVVCLLLAVGGTFAVFHFFIWNKVPADLVGRWVVEGGPMAGGTFEFSRNGAVQMQPPGLPPSNGRVTLNGKTLQTIMYNPNTKREESHWSTIRELTADSLTLELEKGAVLKMVRQK